MNENKLKEKNLQHSTQAGITPMPCYAQPNICLYNANNLDVMSEMQNESIDVICIDPPYLYLKNQKLEREFNEQLFFSECKRLLSKNGFIVLFGRGESFYRWNTILADLELTFKEEIIWNKRRATSPTHKLQRYHETISVFSKGDGIINKIRVPYLKMKEYDIDYDFYIKECNKIINQIEDKQLSLF